MKIDLTLTREQVAAHIDLLHTVKRTGQGINWPWPIEDEIKAHEERLKELAPGPLLVFDEYKDGLYKLRNPATNDTWEFDNALEAKFFVDAFYADDIRPFMEYERKAA